MVGSDLFPIEMWVPFFKGTFVRLQGTWHSYQLPPLRPSRLHHASTGLSSYATQLRRQGDSWGCSTCVGFLTNPQGINHLVLTHPMFQEPCAAMPCCKLSTDLEIIQVTSICFNTLLLLVFDFPQLVANRVNHAFQGLLKMPMVGCSWGLPWQCSVQAQSGHFKPIIELRLILNPGFLSPGKRWERP